MPVQRKSKAVKRARNSIIFHGQVCVLKRYHLDPGIPPPSIRNEIKEFSRSSRFRLLKKLAAIDWEKLGGGKFITLTYPDEVAVASVDEMTMQRHRWIRYAEKYLSEQIPMMWRKEMQQRQSGVHTEKHVQHYHLAAFTAKFLPMKRVNEWWRKCIGWSGYVRTECKAMGSAQHAAMYLAKYLSKPKGICSLVNTSYLNSPGRSWGFHRTGLIPLHPIRTFIDIDDATYDKLLNHARGLTKLPHPECWESFTLLGSAVDRMAEFTLQELA